MLHVAPPRTPRLPFDSLQAPSLAGFRGPTACTPCRGALEPFHRRWRPWRESPPRIYPEIRIPISPSPFVTSHRGYPEISSGAPGGSQRTSASSARIVSRKKPLEKRREEGEEGARAGKKLKGRGISTFPAAAPHHRYPAIQILSLAVPPTFASIGRGGRCPSSPPRIGSPHEEGSCTPSRGSPSCPPSPQAPTDTVRGRNPILPSLQTLIDSINNTLQRRQSTTTLRDLFSTGAPYYATPHW